jgi:purine-cytosine permease-like protein
MHLIQIFVGFIVGGCFGFMVGAILASARYSDECRQCFMRKLGK